MALEHLRRAFGEIEDFIILLDLDVGQLRPDRGGDVRGQRPRRRRPNEQRFTRTIHKWEAHGQTWIGFFYIAFGDNFVLTDARPAAPTPRHDIRAFVHPALLRTFFDEGPDVVIIFVAEGEVRSAQLR